MEFLNNLDADLLLNVGLPLALGIIMFSLGLGLKFSDFTRILRRPLAFFVGAINQTMVLPMVAFLLALLFNLPPALAVGMMIIALCPGGVTSNIMTKYAGGDVALSVTLTAVISLLSIITVPIIISFIVGLFLGRETVVDASELSIKMTAIVAVPVLIGMIIRAILGRFAGAVERFFSAIAIALFVIVMLTALYKFWDEFITNVPTLGPALVAMLVISIFLGWASAKFLKMGKADVTTISLETGVQNGTLGLAIAAIIAGGNTSGLSEFALPSAVYGVLMYIIALPYVLLRRMGHAEKSA